VHSASPEAFQLYERCMATVNRFDLMAGEAAKSPQWPPIKQQYDKRINGRVNIISLDAEQVDKIGKILIETLQEAHAQGFVCFRSLLRDFVLFNFL
jgi:hypothetical protein